jgi:hypothetical protein
MEDAAVVTFQRSFAKRGENGSGYQMQRCEASRPYKGTLSQRIHVLIAPICSEQAVSVEGRKKQMEKIVSNTECEQACESTLAQFPLLKTCRDSVPSRKLANTHLGSLLLALRDDGVDFAVAGLESVLAILFERHTIPDISERTAFVWETFMKNPEAQLGMANAGFRSYS